MRFGGKKVGERQRSSEYFLWLNGVLAARLSVVCPRLKDVSGWFQRPEVRQTKQVFKKLK